MTVNPRAGHYMSDLTKLLFNYDFMITRRWPSSFGTSENDPLPAAIHHWMLTYYDGHFKGAVAKKDFFSL